jgi:hypothetical protein
MAFIEKDAHRQATNFMAGSIGQQYYTKGAYHNGTHAAATSAAARETTATKAGTSNHTTQLNVHHFKNGRHAMRN